jgi:two-component system, NtrC family, nitrogen regulation sensor histidine kinase NtrY
MGLRLRWTLLLSAAALALVAVFAVAIEFARVQQVRRVQSGWEASRAALLHARLETQAREVQNTLDDLVRSASLHEVVAAGSQADGGVRRAQADWAQTESRTRGLEEILVLDREDRVITSARWSEGIGRPHPNAPLLRDLLPGAPLVWRSPDPERPRDDPWMIGAARVHDFGGVRAPVVVGRELDGEWLQLLRVDLELRALHAGPPRTGRGERGFVWPAGWLPFPGAQLAWDPGPAPSVRALEGLRPWLGAAALGAIAVIMLGAPWVAAGLGRPLLQMADAVGAIGRGDRHPVLPIGGPREIGVLRDALLRLSSDLELAEQQIRHAERRAAWREIARRIAHEIRNTLSPLALALDNVETAARRDDPRAQAALATSLNTARAQLQSLQRLVTEFSGFARQPRLVLADFSLGEMLESCAGTLRAAFSGVDLRVRGGDALEFAHGDVEQLRRAVHNLLKNAVEAAPDAPVELMVGRGDAGTWWIEVRDRGPGLPPSIAARLGDPYQTTKADGTGLGLPIVMRVVEAHGGRLEIGARDGGGTVVRIELPSRPVVERSEDEPESEPENT